ncbi:MAG TPA: CBS domain-containing protein [Gaiellaceae bacterium]|nr:CBS domain-containing protein [Gaiellaceae bacterium]
MHRAAATVGELRAFFADDHVHVALLVSGRTLLGAVERADLLAATGDETPALELARLDGRTIAPDATLGAARAAMRRGGHRRLAVVGDGSRLLGLLCLKASGRGFCSDADVRSRRPADALR